MSLFSTKKKVYVASTTYKIIDDGSERTSFMREVIASTALSSGPNASMAAAISRAHLEGPRSTLKSFFRWAKNNFDLGMPRAAINYVDRIDFAAVEAQIRADVLSGDVTAEIEVNHAFIDIADESYYAERFIYENREELAHLDWAADVEIGTGDIWIQYPPGTEYGGSPITSESITVPGFNTSDQVLVAYYTYRIPPADFSFTRVYIYKIGSGVTALDNTENVLEDGTAAREFYPFIPLRINNKSVFDAASSAKPHEDLIRKAYDKLLGANIDDLLTEINSNPDVGDIDYAYLVPGVCLNTKSKYEKLYLYEFFRGLAVKQHSGPTDFTDFVDDNNVLGYHPTYLEGPLLNTLAYPDSEDPGYLQGVRTAVESISPLTQSIHLTIPSAALGVMDMRITWVDITETQYTGVIKQGAKVGDITLKKGFSFIQTNETYLYARTDTMVSDVNSIVIRKQITQSEYIEVIVRGLQHKNLIYQGKSVDITAKQALEDEDDSGFIIPLHEPTLKRLGVVVATELARESFLLVFNSYQVVKTKWYQTGIFKVILTVIIVVAIVVLTYYFGPEAGAGAAKGGAGILGLNAAVGASLGFSGVIAVAIGAAVNTIAAMIVLQIISLGATELFGEKVGAIITAVAAIVIAFGSGPGGFSIDNFSTNLANMASIDKLLAITNATTDIVSVFQQDKLNKILAEIEKTSADYQKEMGDLEKMMKEFDVKNIVDPIMLTDFTNPLFATQVMGKGFILPPNFNEMPTGFLSRTLLTGSELAEISRGLIYDFASLSLTLR
jgi:hypothetical protein